MLSEPAIQSITRGFEEAAPQEIMAWATRTFGHRLALACSFGGPTGMVLLDMMVNIDATIPVYYLDTGVLFAETYEHVERVAKHYGINPIAVRPTLSLSDQAQEYGDALWERNPDLCCKMRKVEPQRDFLRGYSAWISGVRRDHSSSRKSADIVTWDQKFGLVKISPLATWTEEMVWTYINVNNVPYNPLHDRGYRSIGCISCTAPVAPGEELRAGRWKGLSKTECGLHT